MLERITPPLIDTETLLNLPSIEDASMLGYEAMALIRLFVSDIPFSLYVSGSDGDDQLFGLVTTPKQNHLGLFYLSGLEMARTLMNVPLERDITYVAEDIRDISYRHSMKYPSSNPGWWHMNNVI